MSNQGSHSETCPACDKWGATLFGSFGDYQTYECTSCGRFSLSGSTLAQMERRRAPMIIRQRNDGSRWLEFE